MEDKPAAYCLVKNKINELRKQIDVTFKRVPGHQGVADNERADELARKACFGIDL